jgi:acyl dehydratase
MGSLFLGVEVDGPARGDLAPGPVASGGAGTVVAVSRSIPNHAGHVYTETARIYNPIHTDAEVARRAGLPGPILHGTATLAMAVSEVVRVAAAGDPHREVVRQPALPVVGGPVVHDEERRRLVVRDPGR